MWIERVIARAFGPLSDETLELGQGMTVISGPNEAGKTSWHAALRLALTGVRRGPGRTKEVASVIERHRPWDTPERWEVEARLHLADGRTVDISQDLAGRVACRARDVVLGDDVSSEIINDGTPDASKWLGLDRESFSSVAAVNQAQIMAVADSAASLQDQMQRAAATRGTDATAAEAIEKLKAFRREGVGAVRVGATGPLWAAMREQEAAEASVAEARRLHADYLDREARLEDAAAEHVAAERALAVAEAARAIRVATDLSARVERAARLAAAHPSAPPPLAARDELADEVAAALDAWRRRPAAVQLMGPTAAELRVQLAALPSVPVGDRRPDRSVTDALRALDLAEEALRLHQQRAPLPVAAPIPQRRHRGTNPAARRRRRGGCRPARHRPRPAAAGNRAPRGGDRDRGVGGSPRRAEPSASGHLRRRLGAGRRRASDVPSAAPPTRCGRRWSSAVLPQMESFAPRSRRTSRGVPSARISRVPRPEPRGLAARSRHGSRRRRSRRPRAPRPLPSRPACELPLVASGRPMREVRTSWWRASRPGRPSEKRRCE